jgi:hypothetical protein
MSASKYDAKWNEEDKLRAGEYNPWERKLYIIAKKSEVSKFMDPGYVNMINQLRELGEISTAEFMRIAGGDERLMGIIEEGCTDLYRGYIDHCTTSVEALQILREKSLPQTGEEKWNATEELGSISLNYVTGFDDYVARYGNALRKLIGAGVPLDNQMRDSRFISGLGLDMETTRSTLRAMSGTGNVDFNQLVQVAKTGYLQLLKDRPELIKLKGSCKPQEEKNTDNQKNTLNESLLGQLALALMGQFNPRNPTNPVHKRRRCKECGRQGHEFEDCYENKASPNYRGDDWAKANREKRAMYRQKKGKFENARGSHGEKRDNIMDLTETEEGKSLAAILQMIKDGK